MKKLTLMAIATLLLASCTTRAPQESPASIAPAQPPATEPVPVQPPPVINQPIPMPPKIKTIDWQASLSPMVKELVNAEGVSDGSVLLVNTMKNNTNGALQTGKATSALTDLITASGGRFSVIGAAKLNAARQALGLSADDSLESRSKAVGLARNLDAQYVLYSTAGGDVKQPDIDMQLMLVQTGEIIWSGKGVAQE